MRRVGASPTAVFGELAPLLALVFVLTGCGRSAMLDGARTLWHVGDASDDARLVHPAHPGINSGTFELTSFELSETDTHIIAVATFASVVRPLRHMRLSEDRRATIFPQTIDIYVDTLPDGGFVETLPDRGIYVPASEAWDHVLVMSSIRELHVDGVIYASHLLSRGKQLIGIFEKDDIPAPIRGALAVVMASSARGTGRVRLASTFKGVCTDWNQDRCTLVGVGPPIIDATAPVTAKTPVSLTYFDGLRRPAPKTVPVVFRRGRLVGAAPVPSPRIEQGHIATVFDGNGQAIATAVVLNIVDDTATLEVVGDAKVDTAATVAFQNTER